jgi:uncharacterized membrane protein HdeD (DUF308 family)
MLETLVKNWWLVALRGLVALILGILMLVMPELAILSLVIVIGVYMLVDGAFALIVAIVNKPRHRDRWWMFAEGIIGILAGIAIFAAPLLAAIIILYVIGVWAVLTGVLEIIFSIMQWKTLPDKWLLLIGGIVSILLGVFIFANNVEMGAILLITVIAIYLVLFGAVLIALGFSLKNSASSIERQQE